jgi:hypothetical protein
VPYPALELVGPHGDVPASSEELQADLDHHRALQRPEPFGEPIGGREPVQGA